MALKMGWLSTGRDPAARNLLQTVYDDLVSNKVPASIEWIFCHRETGDAAPNEEYYEREKFFDLAASLNIPVATHSHVRFMPELRKRGIAESSSAAEASPALEEWRISTERSDENVNMLPTVDIVIMAGYMLIIGDPELEGMVLVNIHPALPWGPRGTWQEVIHQLIAEEAQEQGIMVHLVTKTLDRGPVISYCRFPIRGEGWDAFWEEWKREIKPDSSREERENHPLFKKIRAEGEVRELPCCGALSVSSHARTSLYGTEDLGGGKIQETGVELTDMIENQF